jgi:ABC-type phosphate transport system substrate-binding protein
MRRQNRIGSALIGLIVSFATRTTHADVVTVVSSKSPILTLSKSQVADIFLGRLSRFPDGESAVPIDQPDASMLRAEFYIKVAGKSPAQLKAHWSKIIFTGRGQPPQIVASSAEVKKLLSNDILAIGYIDDSEIDPSVRVLVKP